MAALRLCAARRWRRPSTHCSAGRCYHRRMRRLVVSCVAMVACAVVVAAAAKDPFTLDRDAARWVEQTLKKLTPDEKVGQVIVPSFDTTYLSSDTDTFEKLVTLTRDYHVGGFHIFGGSEPSPQVLLGAGYGSVILGQPLAAASLINRLQ